MSLLKNSFWNFAGFAVPLVINIPAMDIIACLLGAEQFSHKTPIILRAGEAGVTE